MNRTFQGFLFLAFIFGTSPAGAGDAAAGDQAKGLRPGSFSPVIFVVISDNDYRPKIAKVPIGDYIGWTNRSSTAHTATSDDDGKTFDTGEIAPGKAAYSPFFKTAGEFRYHCKIHGETGTLVVE